MNKKKLWSLIIPIAVFLLVLFLPAETFHMPGLTVVEQRVIALFFLAALCWILEPIPTFATAVLVIVLEIFMISNKGISFLMAGKGTPEFGTLLSSTQIMATMASPVVMLFLGGFFLALAATKYKLDWNLARVLIRPFGKNPRMVLLGLMAITAFFSMFMSNTATTAMMLSILTPVLASIPEGDRGRVAFVLAIPLAANIGGIGTPIGTPPNAIAYKYILDLTSMSFGKWMLFGVPFVFILLIFGWFLLNAFFPTKMKEMNLTIDSKFIKNPKAYIVYATFLVTIALWMIGEFYGVDANVVAMLPIAVFVCTGIVTKNDLKTLSWDVLWLVAGGIALGLALEKTGLAARMVNSIPFSTFAPIAIVLAATLLTLIMANFMSHTATANLLLPLMAALAPSLSGLGAIGGPVGLIIAVTFAASLGMTLPISTPPNALASATGLVETPDMAKVGVVVGLVGLILALCTLLVMTMFGII